MRFDMLAALLLGLAIVDWVTAVILARGALRFGWPALQERAVVAVVIAAVATIAAFLGLTRTRLVELPPGVGIVLLAVALVVMSLPSIAWLVLYWRGGFRDVSR